VNRRTVLIGVGAALVVLLFWYFILWSPRGSAIQDANDRKEAAENEALELRAQINRLREAQRNESATRARIEELRQAIPDEPNLAQFILDTNEAAARSGIDFLSIAPTPPVAAVVDPTAPPPEPGQQAVTAPSQISLSISVTGGYFQVLDFMNRLTDLTRIVVIDTVTVAPAAGSDLSVQLAGRMFTTAVPVGAPGAAETAATTTTTAVVPGATTTTAPGTVTTVAQ
jgi:Tfp pilus assembly protein PilO